MDWQTAKSSGQLPRQATIVHVARITIVRAMVQHTRLRAIAAESTKEEEDDCKAKGDGSG
jgi:hypothetical protein